MTAEDRRQVQEALHRLDYLQGSIDGIFGPLTRTAISRFQHDIGAASTGYLTGEEAILLVGAPAAVAQSITAQALSKAQIDALVASIALYPDDLLPQVLMASTPQRSRLKSWPPHAGWRTPHTMSGDTLVKGAASRAVGPEREIPRASRPSWQP